MLIFVSFSSQEIEKQIVTDVTHLEIPADLALVFANIQGKRTTITQEQTTKSPECEIHSKCISTVHIILILNLDYNTALIPLLEITM